MANDAGLRFHRITLKKKKKKAHRNSEVITLFIKKLKFNIIEGVTTTYCLHLKVILKKTRNKKCY